MKRFYTLPPLEIEYPYILANIKDVKEIEKRKPEHSIIDCGIYDLLKPPFRHSDERIALWKRMEAPGWKVVPDCPSLQYEHGVDLGYRNTDYSKELLKQLYDQNDLSHLPVIQFEIIKGSNSYKQSIKRYIQWFKRKYGQPQNIGVGSVCKAGSKEMVVWVMKHVREQFPKSWVHAFGLKLNHYHAVYRLIDSFDSMAWTFPRGRGRGSCKNKQERIKYFAEYMTAAEEIASDFEFDLLPPGIKNLILHYLKREGRFDSDIALARYLGYNGNISDELLRKSYEDPRKSLLEIRDFIDNVISTI